MVRGTSPPKSAMIICAMPTQCCDLDFQNPSERMTSATSSGEAAAMLAASGQRRKSSGVTRFTEASVVWADSMTLTTVVKGLLKSSCGWALGYSSPMRRHTSTARSRLDLMDSRAILPPSPAADCSQIIPPTTAERRVWNRRRKTRQFAPTTRLKLIRHFRHNTVETVLSHKKSEK